MEFRESEITFREADRRYAYLKRQRDAGTLSAEAFAEQLKQLMVQDAEGVWWAKSRGKGEWHYNDGGTWVLGTPPYQEAMAQPSPANAVTDHRSLPQQGKPEPSGLFGQKIPFRFSYAVLACTLLSVLWVGVRLGLFWLVNPLFPGWAYHVADIFRLASLYYLPAFLMAFGVERWYVALGRSVAIAFLAWILYLPPLTIILGATTDGDIRSSFGAVLFGIIELFVFSAIVGYLAVGATKRRYSTRRSVLIGVVVGFVASGLSVLLQLALILSYILIVDALVLGLY